MHQFFCRIYVNMRIEELFSIIRGEFLNVLGYLNVLYVEQPCASKKKKIRSCTLEKCF